MKFETLRQEMKTRTAFRPEELHGGRGALAHERVQLSRWAEGKKLLRLRRGLYTLPLEEHREDISALSLADPLYRPSYVSLEWALSHYGLIPEAAGSLTSVTTRKTAKFANAFGTFLYRHVHPRFFFGFEWQTGDHPYWLALPEKALLDFVHLSIPRSQPLTRQLFLEGYRLQNLSSLRAVRLRAFMRRFARPRVQEGGTVLLSLLEGAHD